MRWRIIMMALFGLLAVGAAAKTMEKKKVENTFAKPDFAFPETVEKNALPRLEKALAGGDGEQALRAAIQLTIARDLVSSENYRQGLEIFSDLASRTGAPWRQLAMLLEARLYGDIYGSNRFMYDRRHLPADNVPENVLEWDGDMFRAKVVGLVSTALRESGPSASMPLAEISPLLTGTKDAEAAGMTVCDFVAVQTADILSEFESSSGGGGDMIPFGVPSDADPVFTCRANALDGAIRNHQNDSARLLLSELCRLKLEILSGEDRLQFIRKCYEMFSGTDYGSSFVADYAHNLVLYPGYEASRENDINARNEIRRRQLAICKEYVAAHPQARNIGQVYSVINDLESKRISLDFPEQSLSGRAIKVSVSGTNIYAPYILAVPCAVTDNSQGVKYSRLRSVGAAAASLRVNLAGQAPDECEAEVDFPALTPGCYALVASSSKSPRDIYGVKDDVASLILVSDLTAFVTGRGEERILHVAAGSNLKPVPGAKVTFTDRRNSRAATVKVLTTGNNGEVRIPFNSAKYRIEKNGQLFYGDSYSYGNPGDDVDKTIYAAQVLTDLSLFHPGDTVRFVAAVYSRTGHQMRQEPGKGITAVLRDANYQALDTLRLTTDNYGRAEGSFRIPGDRLLGRYSVSLQSGNKGLGDASFTVADYKAPTFRVVTSGTDGECVPGDTVRISGEALTYAGMPVAGAKVAYKVTYRQPWWWRRDTQGASFASETVTGPDGKFVISLPTASLRGTRYERGVFQLDVDVTDKAGETQPASPVMFSMTRAYTISPVIPETLELSDYPESGFSVWVRDIMNRPVTRKVYYRIENVRNGSVVSGGEFESPVFRPELAGLPSSGYKITFSLDKDFKAPDGSMDSTHEFILYRKSDSRPPVDVPLWIPESMVTVPSGVSTVKVSVGSSYPDSYIYAGISDSRRSIRGEWIKVSDGMASIKIDAPADDERVFISLLGMRELRGVSGLVTVVPAVQQEQVEIVAESFRDRIDPTARESWKFRFTAGGRPLADAAAAAVMSNKALNAIAPFSWQMNPAGQLYWNPYRTVDYRNPGRGMNSGFVPVSRPGCIYSYFSFPEWNFYGKELYDMHYPAYVTNVTNEAYGAARSEMLRSVNVTSRKLARGAKMEAAAGEAGDSGSEGAAVQEPLPRDVDTPLAFFMPSMHTDSNGVVELDYVAPNFIGTWQFQIAGWAPDMKGAVRILDVVASKKVMARLNAPRFMRVGDKVGISATLFNNTDAEAPVAGLIELVNPATGVAVASRDFAPGILQAKGSRVVTMDYEVPADFSELTVRVYASSENYRDGEQTIVPVLPGSTPVVESAPFYLRPGEGLFMVKLPKYDKEAKVTLRYCDNPVWECVTALPAILEPESASVFSAAGALYGNAVASGLFREYPGLIAAVREMASPANAADSLLVSNLEKDAALKTVTLRNTPWVNDAAAETMRMASLTQYTDTVRSADAVKKALSRLSDLQRADGGWGWCRGMESSEFITYGVLEYLSDLRQMDYLPRQADGMAKKAFAYCDKEFVQDWERTKKEYFSLRAMLDYLFVKSAFGAGNSAGFGVLENAAMKKIKEEWKSFSIDEKAKTAILLSRKGDDALAGFILESLHQFGSYTPEKGMWFDNLPSGLNGDSRLITTARVLEAFSAIRPHSTDIDKLRQWLVLSRQTENWGDSRNLAGVIRALLSSGTKWTVPSETPSFRIGGREIAAPHIAKYTGSLTVDLNPLEVSGKTLEVVKKSSGPSWGGVISQYVAPILDVKAEKVPQLSIAKAVYVIERGQTGEKAVSSQLRVGDRVRVTLSITSDRDMDYVAVTDARSACLEPDGQVSGYISSDGVGMYMEVRNESTNLFIPFLPKGTHVISYDCHVDRQGVYSLGIATAQSQYSPLMVAHSAGAELSVKDME